MALRDNLVSWWSLEETSGTRNDSHGSNHLTDNNTVGYATGKKGNAANFIDTNIETLSITDASQTGLEPASFSFQMWIYGTMGLGKYFGGKAYASTHISPYQAYSFATDGTNGRFCVQGNSAGTAFTEIGTTVASSNTWYHLVQTYDGTTLKLYVNATNEVSVAKSAISYSDGPFRIGGNSSYPNLGYTFNGRQDEVAVWSRALTGAEVTSLYNSGNGMSYADTAPASTFIPHISFIM